MTYSVEVTVSSGTVTSSEGTVTNTSGNVWTVSAITAGTNITVTVEDIYSCEQTLSVIAPDCSCPVTIAPTVPSGASVCFGITPNPAISATVGSGETIDWYADAIGGIALSTGNLNYVSTETAVNVYTYYAETRNTTTNCTSDTRTAVTFTIQDCDADLSLRKTVDNSTPNVGDEITFTVTLNNNGPSDATTIIVRDIIPTDFTYTHLPTNYSTSQGTVTFNSSALTWDLGAYVLTNGSSITLSYTIKVDVCGEFKNQVEIIQSSHADSDSTPNNGN